MYFKRIHNGCASFVNSDMSILRETIKGQFATILAENGSEVENVNKSKKFNALISSGDFVAAFTLGDQDTELSIQGTTWNEDCPQTGDVLQIDGKKYITQTVQSRTNGPISKFTAYLKD